MFITIGMVGVIKKGYNPLTDKAGLVFFLVNLLILNGISILAKLIANGSGIWIPKSQPKPKVIQRVMSYFFGLRLKIKKNRKATLRPDEKRRASVAKRNTNLKTRKSFSLIRLPLGPEVDSIQQDIMAQEKSRDTLKNGLYLSPDFRDLFIRTQKEWIRSRIRMILTPRTRYQHRDTILREFGRVYGFIERETAETQGEFYSDKKAEKQDFVAVWNYKSSKKKLMIRRVSLFWLNRARKLKKAKGEIGMFMELNTNDKCCFCGATYGLRNEPIDSIDEVFFQKFIRMIGAKNPRNIWSYDLKEWQKFFFKTAKLRTTCYNCTLQINIRYQKSKVLKEKAATKRQSLL